VTNIQTEKDKKIQSQLDSAGKGLPVFEAFFLKRIGFPLLKKFVSWDLAMKLFEHEGQKILNDVKQLDDNALFKKVLIPKVLGIEDNSRYYSPAMVLWHLIYVGETIQSGIISLSRNEHIDFVVKIESFKPFVEIAPDIVSKYASFLNGYKATIEKSLQDKYTHNYHAHPWFGPLNPHQWLIMSAIHQLVHGRQLRKILASVNR
jgi:hypothetical protein